MNISDEAVEAAAYALYLDANPDSETQWFDIGFHEQDELLRASRAALEAAAPHILADAANLVAELVDVENCSFDHHGGCQAHGYLSLKPGETCPQHDAKEFVRPNPDRSKP